MHHSTGFFKKSGLYSQQFEVMKKKERSEEIHSVSKNKKPLEPDIFPATTAMVTLKCGGHETETPHPERPDCLPGSPEPQHVFSPPTLLQDPKRVIGYNRVPEIRIRLKMFKTL